MKPSPSHPNPTWPVLKVASIQCWAAHQCVILEKNWASTGDHGKIWENLLEKRGRKSWRKKRKLGIDLGVIASYRDWSRCSVSIIVTSTETLPASQIHTLYSENRLDMSIIEAKIPNVHPFGHFLPPFFWGWSGAPALLTDTWWVATNSIHDWGWSKGFCCWVYHILTT